MIIDSLALGAYETNCYVLRSNETIKECLIIDAGLGAVKLIRFLRENQLSPVPPCIQWDRVQWLMHTLRLSHPLKRLTAPVLCPGWL